MKKITVTISDEQARRLDRAVQERQLSRDEVVREALSLFVQGDPRKVMIARNLEAIERIRALTTPPRLRQVTSQAVRRSSPCGAAPRCDSS
jgi:Arc/MetJ-type ribon-helix-helix transcriptional regulator